MEEYHMFKQTLFHTVKEQALLWSNTLLCSLLNHVSIIK